MKASLSSLSMRALAGLLVAGLLIWAIALWLLYVSPQRSEAADLRARVADARADLTQARTGPHRAVNTQASDVLRLVKAMPASGDQSGLVLELTDLARRSNVALRSITSEASAEGPGGTTMIPVTVTIGGRFAEVTRFVKAARSLVSVRHGKLSATGRLFSVQSVDLTESVSRGFPQLDATIILDAFVYDGPIQPKTPADSGSTDTTSSETSAAPGGTG